MQKVVGSSPIIRSEEGPGDGAFVLLLPAACALLLLTCLLFTHAHQWKGGLDRDTTSYAEYGNRILDGDVPYRDVAIEYPPAALPTFVVPALGGATGTEFRWRFEWLMALCGCGLLVVLAATLRTVGARPLWLLAAAATPLLLGSLSFKRYDLWPALLTSLTVLLFLRGRSRGGGAALGLAAAAKLYPAFLAPVLIAQVWRRRGRREALVSLGLALAVFAACFVPFVVVAPHGTLRTFTLQVHRPLEVESLGAAVLILAHHLGAGGITTVRSFGSVNLAGSGVGVVGALTTVGEAIALMAIWWLAARRRLDAVATATAVAAVVAALLVFGKVFSPQYLLWLAGLVVLVAPSVRSRVVALLLCSCLLTQAYVEHRFGLLEQLGTPESLDVLVRDLLVLALLGALAAALRRAPAA